ncbi:Kynurenine 3-monooxygenase [Seminavis robusta]|uniref:Kynurenine 3-monooxygenase n=1 Tax=Seminavis robusta TaxID=568900 RepID=A0A9N8EE13_9STRA|nr:Kynurenine 3-monooxygenase [Seminavis robusta]|eukprot:Sro1015_g231550.1 Kynurenine 3-monooxygenase (637) ;mRNA; r:26866-28864
MMKAVRWSTLLWLVVLGTPTCSAFSTAVVSATRGAKLLGGGRFRTFPSSTHTRQQSSLDASVPVDSTIPSAADDKSTGFPDKPSYRHYDAIICGGGPAGLLAAIMLSQKFGPSYKIAVCEQRAAIPPSPSDETVWSDIARFYLLGIGHRGQSALKKFGVLEDFFKASVENLGRRDWQPGMTKVEDGRTTIATKDPPSRVLARDKLVGVLHEHLVREYTEGKGATIDLLYGFQVDPVSFGVDNDNAEEAVKVRISPCQDIVDGPTIPVAAYAASQDAEQLCDAEGSSMVTTDFLIGADGAARTVAKAMEDADRERYNSYNPLRRLFAERPFRVTSFNDDNPRVYKSVPILLPKDWPRGLNYSARSKDSRVTLEALPSDDKGNLCALLLMKPDDELAQPNTPPALLRKFFDEEFPQFGALLDDEEIANIAQKPASKLPVFRFVGPRLRLGQRTMVLGDAAHTVKPYYGLGANTALEDVQVLSELLDDCDKDIPKAVKAFSDRRAGDAAALVTISRNMDRPGKWFLVNFLLPLILDGIFHKVAPQIFGPNMFGMFQKKGMGFKQIQRKKRLDRALQLTIIGAVLTGIGASLKAAVRLLARATGQHQSVVSMSLVLASSMIVLLRRSIQNKETKLAKETA